MEWSIWFSSFWRKSDKHTKLLGKQSLYMANRETKYLQIKWLTQTLSGRCVKLLGTTVPFFFWVLWANGFLGNCYSYISKRKTMQLSKVQPEIHLCHKWNVKENLMLWLKSCKSFNVRSLGAWQLQPLLPCPQKPVLWHSCEHKAWNNQPISVWSLGQI